jgi:hypothetical protein
MQEVTARLCFNRECLGFAKRQTSRRQVIYVMPRDSSGRVMFLPSWWKGRFRYAAKVVNRYNNLVKKIAWDPIVDGRVSKWRRVVVSHRDDPGGRERYALHEAFRRGDTIGVNAVLPDGLSVDAFSELLSVVGTYKGISPFQDEHETYGTFEVVSVTPTVRSRDSSMQEHQQPPAVY